MGAVYLAEHIQIGRRDAIKVLRDSLASDPEAIARFLRGTRNVSRVRHPNVCAIYDFTETPEGLRFLAMEYVDGPTLKELLEREGRMSLERAVDIAAQAADALQAAHAVGIVHRDLKPGNIMVVGDPGGRDTVKVVDFDIAKGPEGGEEVTRLGFVVGTPEYMSPEQLMGEALDGRSDLYSLGLVLFRMLTGLHPFRAEGPQDLMVARLTSQPMRLDEARPGETFPEELQRALGRALRAKPAERQADVAEFAREVRGASVGAGPLASPIPPTLVTPAAFRPPFATGGGESMGEVAGGPGGGRWSQPQWKWVAGGLGSVLVTGIVVAVAWQSGTPPAPSPLPLPPAAGAEAGGGGETVVGGPGELGAGTGGEESVEEVQGAGVGEESLSSQFPGTEGPPTPDIRFASSRALEDMLLALEPRLTDLSSPPGSASLAGIRDTLMAGLEQADGPGQRRIAARLLAFVDHYRGDPAGCRGWSAEVERMGGGVAELQTLCPPGGP
jgi:serine/threonine-protein kinase